MQQNSEQKQWESYVKEELSLLTPLLNARGHVLDEDQPHLSGERFLMQAVTTSSGKKLILLGMHQEKGVRVVIKATRDTRGTQELQHEHTCRTLLNTLDFAYDTFTAPAEISFFEKDGFLISVQEYIEQESTFLERPLSEQFSFALQAFKVQESAHATTHNHIRAITRTFGKKDTEDYLASFSTFKRTIGKNVQDDGELVTALSTAERILIEHQRTLTQYGGFLTHTDFVPHNFRIKNNTLYLLDFSSIRFGNKHEGWARFVNFMALYNPPLQSAIEQYVKDNRAPEEYESLWLMRIYRLGEIIFYYTETLAKTDGDLRALNQARVAFWGDVLKAVLEKKEVSEERINTYKTTREALRSDDEKKRQQGLH